MELSTILDDPIELASVQLGDSSAPVILEET